MAQELKNNDYSKNSVEPDRCLAQIVTVDQLSVIEGAQNIELAHVLGWQCVVKKQEFQIGDLVIYFSIDSVLDPNHCNFQFLEGKRLKTKKILNTLSQGLLAPLSWLTDYDQSFDLSNVKLNDNVTDVLKVRKFVTSSELRQYSDEQNCEAFPSFVPKTEEQRVQNIPTVLKQLVGQDIVITRKEDGTSTTYVFCQNQSSPQIFLICGRNRVLRGKTPVNPPFLLNGVQQGCPLPHIKGGSHYFEMAERFDIKQKMKQLGLNIAIQGEIVGPKIGGNKLKLKENDFRVFNIWDIDNQCYLQWEQVEQITDQLQLHRVPVLYKGTFQPEMAMVKHLLEMANLIEYDKNIPAEGMIVKTNYGKERPRHSFKVISNKFLLRNN